MKKDTIVLLAALLLCAGYSPAQALSNTNTITGEVTTASDQTGTIAGLFTGSTNGIFASLQKGIGDAINFAEGVTNNGRIAFEGGALYATGSKSWGYFGNVYLPLSGTNNVLGAGFGFAYLNHDWYDATLDARLGTMIPLPLNAQALFPLYAYIESGGGYNFQSKAGVAQAFSGASLRYSLFRTKSGNSFDLTAGAAIGTISDQRGNIQAYGGSVNFAF